MFRLFLNRNVVFERRLLQRCFENDAEAQAYFRAYSYLSQVYRTAQEVNLHYNRVLNDQELDDFCKVLTGKIYKGYKVLPHWRRDLHDRIRQYVFRATEKFLKDL